MRPGAYIRGPVEQLLAWTLSDLADSGRPGPGEVAMALGYRIDGSTAARAA